MLKVHCVLSAALAACSPAASSFSPDGATGSTIDVSPELAPPSCTGREAAFVVSGTTAGVVAITGYPGTWSAPLAISDDIAGSAVGFIDEYNAFGAFWVTANGTSRFRRYEAAGLGAVSAPQTFQPLPGSRIIDLGVVLVGRTAAGVVSSWFDPDGFSFGPINASNPPAAAGPIGAAVDGSDISITSVGSDHVVFDQRLVQYTSWTEAHRHVGLVSGTGEIEMSAPQLVTLADGGAVLITPAVTAEGVVLAASVRTPAGVWSSPDLAPGRDRLSVSATATPGGEVVVATHDAGGVTVLRYSRTHGWRTVGTVDPEAESNHDWITAARGICGDDALIVYATTTGELRTVRVRGDQLSAPSALGIARPQAVTGLSLVTRPQP